MQVSAWNSPIAEWEHELETRHAVLERSHSKVMPSHEILVSISRKHEAKMSMLFRERGAGTCCRSCRRAE